MARRRTLAASAVLSLLLGGSVSTAAAYADGGADLYVDGGAAGCSDSGPGSQAQPFCQLQPAADAATPGATVHVAPTTTAYAPVTISAAGTADAPVAFVPAAPHTVFTVKGTGTSAVTFAGARYVTMSGFAAAATGAASLAFTDSQHVGADSGRVRSVFPGAAPRATVTVDGTSSGLSLTRLTFSLVPGPAFTAAAGARDITLAADTVLTTATGSGISADGADGVLMAGDTITTYCGDAVTLTGGTSASLENTVVSQQGTSSTCPTTDPGGIVVDADSAPKVTADYNAVNPPSGGHDYTWAGTAYPTAAAFHAATGQGAHDLDQTAGLFLFGRVTEHSPLVDSADADAPGETATDQSGKARVDDPLVADTGRGAPHYDRGATEFQDPLDVLRLNAPGQPYAGKPYTYTAVLSDPWSTSAGVTYAFDFGDGQTLVSGTAAVTHTYAEQGSYEPQVTAVKADGTALPSSRGARVEVQPILPLTAEVSCSSVPSAPDATACLLGTGTSYYPATSGRTTFGDGSAAVPDTGDGRTLGHTYAAPGTYTVTRTVTDAGGRTATATAQAIVGTSFMAGWPTRVLDTRNGTGAARRKIGPGGVVRVKVLDAQVAPTTGVRAVTMNVTDVNATSSSVVTAYPDGAARPRTSNLNFSAGQVNPNLVTVPVGKDGYVDLHNAFGYVDLVADVQGYYYGKPPTNWENAMTGTAPVGPVRVLDTRNGTGARRGAVGSGGSVTVTLPGASGPAAQSALLHVTVTGGTGNGVVSLNCGDAVWTTSNLNYRARQTVSNTVAVPLCAGGRVTLHNIGASVQLIADLQALDTDDYAGMPSVDDTSPSGMPFVPTSPTRFLDTRSGLGARAGAVGANGTLTVKVAGVGAVPRGARAVLVNLTGTAPTTGTNVTAYGPGPLPVASTLNLTRGGTRPTLTLVPLDADGAIHLHNFAGSVHLVADLEGYFG